MPALPNDEEGHQSVDNHGRGDRNAIGRCQIGRRAESKDHHHDEDENQPVDARHIDLAGDAFRRVPDFETWDEAELNGLPRQRECAGNDGLTGDHRCKRREDQHRDQHELRVETVERILDGVRIVHDERTLAEIIEDQRRHHEIEPRHRDRPASEVAEVGIKRFGARTGEKHETHYRQSEHAMRVDEFDSIKRIESQKNVQVVGDMHQSAERQDSEPDCHDGAEKLRDSRRAVRLHPEKARQHDERCRYDGDLKLWGDELQAFDSRQHGDGRRNNSIAIEEGRACDPEGAEQWSTAPCDTLA